MISEEKLKELVEKKEKVYSIYKFRDKETIKEYIADVDMIGYGYHFYETKEEAEFVAKYHCSKTIKFEPPTFEEFFNQIYWECENVEIIDCINDTIKVKECWYGADDYDSKYFDYKDNEFECTRKQAYYQAVEYAKKLFLGEE